MFIGAAENFTIYAPAGNETWLDPAAYDASAQTWAGYPIEFYEFKNPSGTVGNLTWELDKEGTLTISGKGRMGNYTVGNAPWKEHVREILRIVIGEGVTDICFEAFEGCINLKYLTVEGKNRQFSDDGDVIYNKNKNELLCVPAGITGEYVILESMTEIADGAFAGCENLAGIKTVQPVRKLLRAPGAAENIVTLPESVEKLGARAFEGCGSITEIKIGADVQSIGAGAFDGIVISGLIAILLAELLGEIIERMRRGTRANVRKENAQ